MKTTHTLIAAALIAVAVAARTGSAAGVGIGQPAPGFTLSDADGTERSLQEFAGKHVVLEWFNNDCPFVKKHYDSGNMQKLQADATGKGVVWLTINSSAPGKQGHLTPELARQVVQQRQSHQTAVLLDPDGAVGKTYGAKTTPHMFIVDPQGKLIYMGGIDDKASTNADDISGSTNYVQQALDQALAGQPVATPQTESYGCSVKYAE